MARLYLRQKPAERSQGDHAGDQPPDRLVEFPPRPKGKATRNFGQGREDIEERAHINIRLYFGAPGLALGPLDRGDLPRALFAHKTDMVGAAMR